MSEPAPEERPRPRFRLGLSAKLMILTLAFVMLAEILIFVPSIANFRNNWLADRLASAQTAALVIEASPADAIPDALVERLLDNVGARSIALKIGGTRRLIAVNDVTPDFAREVDLRSRSPIGEIIDSLSTMTAQGETMMRVVGPAPMGGEFIELVLPERPLRQAMWRFSINILWLSMVISLITAALVYGGLYRLIVRPVKQLAESISAFEQDTGRIIKPSGRRDEIGDAEQTLAGMQTALSLQIKQQQRLAALGLAVAKINHDLRNLLSSAHLLSDRIATVSDPTVQRLAPKLVGALDRAVNFCQATLAYGKAEERPPAPRTFELGQLVTDLKDLLALDEDSPVEFVADFPKPMLIRADPDQLLRVMMNLGRNALEAMAQQAGGPPHRLTVEARRTAEGVEIDIRDTGVGIPKARRDTLFRPFSASRTIGGTGLGLSIADELMRAQSGSIRLLDTETGTCFRLFLPA